MTMEILARIGELGIFVLGILGMIYRMGTMATRFELIGRQQAAEIGELKEAVKVLVQLQVAQASLSGRIDRLEDRQLAEGKRVDELTTRVNRVVNGHD